MDKSTTCTVDLTNETMDKSTTHTVDLTNETMDKSTSINQKSQILPVICQEEARKARLEEARLLESMKFLDRQQARLGRRL